MAMQFPLSERAGGRNSEQSGSAYTSLSVRVPADLLNYLDGLGGVRNRSSAVRTILEAVFRAHADECVIQDLVESITDPAGRRHYRQEMFR